MEATRQLIALFCTYFSKFLSATSTAQCTAESSKVQCLPKCPPLVASQVSTPYSATPPQNTSLKRSHPLRTTLLRMPPLTCTTTALVETSIPQCIPVTMLQAALRALNR